MVIHFPVSNTCPIWFFLYKLNGLLIIEIIAIIKDKCKCYYLFRVLKPFCQPRPWEELSHWILRFKLATNILLVMRLLKS